MLSTPIPKGLMFTSHSLLKEKIALFILVEKGRPGVQERKWPYELKKERRIRRSNLSDPNKVLLSKLHLCRD